MKLITFVVPCYNSADYMDRCIQTLIPCGEEAEIIIVDDGSTDDGATAEKADGWQRRVPNMIRVIHQENKGHGGAVNTGLAHAIGLYFKVVDSDDWLDEQAMKNVLMVLRRFRGLMALDMLVCNYVYEHTFEDKQKRMSYHRQFPRGQVFDWDGTKHFSDSSPLLMHSVIYRTQVLRDCGLELPEHTFYVDNIFVYVPLPHCKRIYYLDVDLYRYFIGREDQSVNESVMVSRIDQQLRITKVMIDSVKIPEDVPSKKLQQYMVNYLTLMMSICSVFLLLSEREDKLVLHREIWAYLKMKDPKLYRKIRTTFMGISSNLRGRIGHKTTLVIYHIAQKVFKFN